MQRLLLSPFVLALLLVFPLSARGDVKLPAIFGSHMVLQRDRPVPVWGTADPGEEVAVEFGGKTERTKADASGKWKVALPACTADAKGRTLTVTGKNKIELTDVLVGEVWVGSGQSNMEWSLSASQRAKEFIGGAANPNIRIFHVEKRQAKEPLADLMPFAFKGKPSPAQVRHTWQAAAPASVPQFSAVLYHFGARLQKDLGVPIGLINSSWGGSPIEPWTVKGKVSGGMYNAMIAPLQPFAIRGVTWYQGESNMGQGLAYREKMADLIAGWRAVWGAELPFYFVQIAPYSRYGKQPLAELWEAQTAALKIPHTGMVVITDLVDNINDIHPGNKHDVGTRLALWALAKTYGRSGLVYSGPLYREMAVEGDAIRLRFAHTGGGLRSRDGKELTEFEIAGDDGKFVSARAKIDGNTVVVSSPDVRTPTQVRFGWRNIANPNLMNAEGLPAGPFRTRNWQGGTGE